MTAELTHRNHHEKITAYGTGTHTHHRARLSHGSEAVGYWRCAQGTAPTFHCPDDPDPWLALTEKIVRRGALLMPTRDRCRYGHAAEYQTRNKQGSAICLECRRLASVKARMKRAATAIVAAAMAA